MELIIEICFIFYYGGRIQTPTLSGKQCNLLLSCSKFIKLLMSLEINLRIHLLNKPPIVHKAAIIIK